MLEDVAETLGRFCGKAEWLAVGARCEGEGAMVEHALRVVAGVGGHLDAKVAEHRVGMPSAKEGDVVRIDAS